MTPEEGEISFVQFFAERAGREPQLVNNAGLSDAIARAAAFAYVQTRMLEDERRRLDDEAEHRALRDSLPWFFRWMAQ